MSRRTGRDRRVVVTGRLAPFASAYGLRLSELGYQPSTVTLLLGEVACLSGWMDKEGLEAEDLSEVNVGRFVAVRRAGRRGPCTAAALRVLLQVLAEAGVGPRVVEVDAPPSALESVLASFRHYLRAERALAASTVDRYVGQAGRFLEDCEVKGDVSRLSSTVVTRAVQAEASRVEVAATQHFVSALRSFLRFCSLDGLVDVDLAAAALAVTGRRRSSLPRGITDIDASALLASCDRASNTGRRDYAILLVLRRLGLRASEVAGLRLDDVDWRAGELVVRGKGSREDRMPVPADVGEAIVDYLRQGRPVSAHREVFLCAKAPIGPLGRGVVAGVVRRACQRAGVVEIGPHRLRHTLACELVTAGVGLSDIGQVLRHRGVSSTSIYARVDVDALRALALPWPGDERR